MLSEPESRHSEDAIPCHPSTLIGALPRSQGLAPSIIPYLANGLWISRYAISSYAAASFPNLRANAERDRYAGCTLITSSRPNFDKGPTVDATPARIDVTVIRSNTDMQLGG